MSRSVGTVSRTRVNTAVAAEFVVALQNGILSRREARRLVALALEQLREASAPEDELSAIEPVIRAARQLTLARTTREYLARFETRAAEVIRGASEAGAAPPISPDSPALRERVRAALAHALGNAGLFSVTGARPGPDATIELDLLVHDAPARVRLGSNADGVETVVGVELLEPPEVLDPEIAQRLAELLRGAPGLEDAVVHAYAGRPSHRGVEWSVALGTASGLQARTLTLDGDEPTVDVFRYDPNAARALASQLALALALEMADQAGPFAQLEVLVRASMRTPDELMPTAPEDSPVGFDELEEAQWSAAGVWGDLAVYVTFHRATGAIRVEDFN